MGEYLAMSDCGICGNLFSFNVNRVPCFPIDKAKMPGLGRLSTAGSNQPVCERCFDEINKFRNKHGLENLPSMEGAWNINKS